MSRWWRGLALTTLLGLALVIEGGHLNRGAPVGIVGAIGPAGLTDGAVDLVGLVATPDGGVTLASETAAWSEAPYARAGTLVGPVVDLAEPAGAVIAGWQGATPAGSAIRLELRGWVDQRALPWSEAGDDGAAVALTEPAVAIQYRLTLLALADGPSPVVRAVTLTPVAAATEPSLAANATAVTSARVFATRIGLIGRTTANGTVIAPEDQFVALPSRRVLATRGEREYEVRVDYRERSLTFPVWDIGPWNVRDNYWETNPRRDMWNDLPPGRPQAVAAYFDAYHGGRDGFGRRVLSPAAIDISDGAFNALGMTQGDWVTVTFLWLPGRR